MRITDQVYILWFETAGSRTLRGQVKVPASPGEPEVLFWFWEFRTPSEFWLQATLHVCMSSSCKGLELCLSKSSAHCCSGALWQNVSCSRSSISASFEPWLKSQKRTWPSDVKCSDWFFFPVWLGNSEHNLKTSWDKNRLCCPAYAAGCVQHLLTQRVTSVHV